MGERLTEVQRREITLLINDPKYGSSNRERDRARATLKRMGLISFNRKTWAWVVLPASRALLEGEARE